MQHMGIVHSFQKSTVVGRTLKSKAVRNELRNEAYFKQHEVHVGGSFQTRSHIVVGSMFMLCYC